MNKRFGHLRFTFAITLAITLLLATTALPAETNNIPNPLVDYKTFLNHAAEVGRLRDAHRVTEQKFMEMAAEPETVIFDARSNDKYDQLHIKGAAHLSFPEITADTLAKIFPSKSTRILIYCNNNFLNSPIAFASKAPSASLNIHTFNTLYSYGYTNVYELGPLLDIKTTSLPFEGTMLSRSK
jgi:hypothetical protein